MYSLTDRLNPLQPYTGCYAVAMSFVLTIMRFPPNKGVTGKRLSTLENGQAFPRRKAGAGGGGLCDYITLFAGNATTLKEPNFMFLTVICNPPVIDRQGVPRFR